MSTFKVGEKVETDKGKGKIGFYGETNFAPGIWVGIILDKDNGKNNGTIDGVKYFSCPDKYGIFMKPSQVRREGERRSSTRASIASSARQSKAPSTKVSVKNSPIPTPRSMSPSKTVNNLSNTNIPSTRKSSSGIKSPRSNSKPPNSGTTTTSITSNNDSLHSSGQSNESFEMVKEESIPEIKDSIVEEVKDSDMIDELEKPVEISPIKYVPPPDLDEGKELEYLRSKNVDLEEQVEVLKIKIREFRPKIHEFERLKVTVQKFEENKKQILEQNSRLKRELEEYKHRLEESLKKIEETEIPDIIELKGQIEELSIDKEIAEEECEIVKAELESYKIQFAEKEKELSLLKSEMERADISSGGNSLQYAALQRQNESLSDAVNKLRDHIAQGKIVESENMKVIERLKQEIEDYEELTNNQEAEIAELKNMLSDYSEQIDAAAGAEKVIDSLTEKNLELEDKLGDLNEKIIELEELNDINEQLLACAKEDEARNKRQLDEEIGSVNMLRKTLRIREEEIDKFELTIQQFRNRITDLNIEIQNKEDELLIEREKLQEKEANADVPVYSSNKVFAELVDLELYRINCEYAQMAAKLLKFFLPDNFSKPGGDNDALLLSISLPRVAAKSIALGNLLSKKYPLVPGGMRREHVTRSHRGEQWGYVANISYILSNLKVIAKKFEGTLQSCSVGKLASICHLQSEFAHHEKVLDSYFELLKQDRLDENSSIEPLYQIVHHFSYSFEVNMSMESYDNKEMLINICTQLTRGFEWVNINGQRILYYLEDNYSRENDIIRSFNKIMETITEGEKLLIRTQNSIPKDKDIQVNSEFMDFIYTIITSLEKIAKVFVFTCKAATSMMNSFNECDGLRIGQLGECIHNSVEKIAGSIPSDKALEHIQSFADNIVSGLDKVSKIMEEDSLVTTKVGKKPYSALYERGIARKNDSQELESLRWQVTSKDEQIRELSYALKEKKDCIRNLELKLETHIKNIEGGKGSDKRVELIKKECEEKIKKCREEQETLLSEIDELNKQLEMISVEKPAHLTQFNDSQSPLDKSHKKNNDSDVLKEVTGLVDILRKNYQNLQDNYKYVNYKNCSLQARQNETIIRTLKPLKEANSVAGIYSLRSFNKNKNKNDIVTLSLEADKLNSEWSLLQLEGINPKNKRQYQMKVENYNNRVQALEFKFFTYWGMNHPGEDLPKTFKKPRKMVDNNVSKENEQPSIRTNKLLEKWCNIR
ncbi:Restin homolog [Strongyloides ratti]|uniref:Dynactin subunit 1 n=1 Tax=Strongyloides ratti TaxID=34506 RepID=A0A090L5U7_STRRB|nr:Restin homolog [Strongyloides ratti]CEF65092.1 Restin homolog [Strongyloides ratti]